MTIDRVLVLCPGRSGSTTWARACGHATNWTSGHETRARNWRHRLDYPTGHIEVDHRLSWFLGTIARRIDHDSTLYVHLTRDPQRVAESWSVRRNRGGQQRTWESVVLYEPRGMPPADAARLMVETVNDNIDLFLAGRPHVIRVAIEDPHGPFDDMWERIQAEGDLAAAHAELDVRHNARRSRR